MIWKRNSISIGHLSFISLSINSFVFSLLMFIVVNLISLSIRFDWFSRFVPIQACLVLFLFPFSFFRRPGSTFEQAKRFISFASCKRKCQDSLATLFGFAFFFSQPLTVLTADLKDLGRGLLRVFFFFLFFPSCCHVLSVFRQQSTHFITRHCNQHSVDSCSTSRPTPIICSNSLGFHKGLL